MSEHAVSIEEAMQRLDVLPDYDAGGGPGPHVHTFAEVGFGLLGAHWDLDAVRALIEVNGVEEAGSTAVAMGHALVVIRPAPLGPLFLATKAAES